jgi:Tfp pilus assembly protein PilF
MDGSTILTNTRGDGMAYTKTRPHQEDRHERTATHRRILSFPHRPVRSARQRLNPALPGPAQSQPPRDSLAHYQLAEAFVLQKNYQSAANEFREALNGSLDPRWTEVWSHLGLAKVFDASGQHERASNEPRQALRTGDDTGGAQDVASSRFNRSSPL